MTKIQVTPDSVALPANQSVNVAQIAGTAPTTVGKIDVKAADGDVFVRQATAANFNATVVGSLGDNGAAAASDRTGVLPAIAQATPPAAGTAGRNVAQLTDLNRVTYTGQFSLNIPTYSANKLGLVTVATPTDIAYLSGNATNTVLVTRVEMSCTQTTAGLIDVALIKRSTANSGGTCAAMTAVPNDSGFAAASSVATSCTANPTLGSAVGNVDSKKIGVMAPATTGNDYYLWTPGMGQTVVLRGTAQVLALNLNSVTLTGGNCNITFQWIEAAGY
jgi:hypothetical protein